MVVAAIFAQAVIVALITRFAHRANRDIMQSKFLSTAKSIMLSNELDLDLDLMVELLFVIGVVRQIACELTLLRQRLTIYTICAVQLS